MGENDAIAKLRTLSKSEFNVLKLYCQSYRYRDIAKELYMQTSSVKNYMGRIYVKLGLDQLPNRARTFAMARVYCPAIKEFEKRKGKDKSLVLVGKEVEPEPIKGELMKIVEEDDGGAEEIVEGEIIKIDTTPIPPPDYPSQRRKPNPLLIGFLVIAFLSILFTGYSLYDRFFKQPAAVPEQSTVAEQPTEEVAIADLPQVIPTETKLVSTETFTPEPTAPPQPAILFEDDFETGLSNDWEVVLGKPIIVNGTLSTDQDTWLLVGDSSWQNYSVEFITDSPYGFFWNGFNVIGVRAEGIDNMYAYKWTESETGAFIIKNGDWAEVPQTDIWLYRDATMNFRMTVVDDLVTLYIDGGKILSFVDDSYPSGKVALKLFAEATIDNFKIKEIL